jgi:hypothetical protein
MRTPGSLSRTIARDDGRSGRDLPGGVRGLQSRSGAARRGASRHSRTAGGTRRLSRVVEAFLRLSPNMVSRANMRASASFRSVEGRGGCRSADRADDRGSESARIGGDERRRAGHSGGQNPTTRRKCRRSSCSNPTARCSTARPISRPSSIACRRRIPIFILYVVDQRQHGHFEQVFRASKKAGLNGNAGSNMRASAR